eukprot:scaffold111285_cov21-Tisochrysis_lutea.AAC.3
MIGLPACCHDSWALCARCPVPVCARALVRACACSCTCVCLCALVCACVCLCVPAALRCVQQEADCFCLSFYIIPSTSCAPKNVRSTHDTCGPHSH